MENTIQHEIQNDIKPSDPTRRNPPVLPDLEGLSFSEYVNKKFNLNTASDTYKRPFYPSDGLSIQPCDSMGAKDGEHLNDKTHVCSEGRRVQPEGLDSSLVTFSSKTPTDDNLFSVLYGTLPATINIPEMIDKVHATFENVSPDTKHRSIPYLIAAEILKQVPANLSKPEFEPYWKAISGLHNDDIEQSKKKCMIFKQRGFNHYKIGPYTTRFTDKDYRKKQYQKMENIFSRSARNYKTAVFLTITLAPSNDVSLFEFNRTARLGANKMIKHYLNKLSKSGINATYVMSPEYQRNGRIHFHVIIFGPSRLEDIKKINKYAHSIGLGYSDVVSLVSDNGYWHRKKDNYDYSNYLSYYLRKSINDPVIACLYWSNNQKFFSNSECYNLPEYEAESIFQTLFPVSEYQYLGTYLISTIRDFFDSMYSSGSKNLLTGYGLEPPMEDRTIVQKYTIHLTVYNPLIAEILPSATYNKREPITLLNDCVLICHEGRYTKIPYEAASALYTVIESNQDFARALGVIV